MDPRRKTLSAAPHRLAPFVLAVAVTCLWSGASAQVQERCYGVAPAGRNDGIGDREEPGKSRFDYQGNAWMLVPEGTCTRVTLPPQPDGTPRRGALEPLTRDTGS